VYPSNFSTHTLHTSIQSGSVVWTKEQEEERRELMKDAVACGQMIKELESDLLSRLSSTYQCIIDDADFVRDLSDTQVKIIV